MNKNIRCFLSMLFLLLILTISSPRLSLAQECGSLQKCEFVVQALQAARKLKPEMYRQDVENQFEQDGAVSSRKTTYVFKKCPYIKIDVEFSNPEVDRRISPTDKILSVSKPYLDEPVK